MPTGTGKTETMLSLLIAAQCERLIVTVPSDSLRGQLSQKFCTLGLLKAFGIVLPTVEQPILGILHAIPDAPFEGDDLETMERFRDYLTKHVYDNHPVFRPSVF